MTGFDDDLPPPTGEPVRVDLPPPVPDAQPSATTKRAHSCEICARRPAMKTHARKYTGLGLIGRTTFWKGNACKQCATSLYRDGLTHCLCAGWWGIVALFWNPVVIAKNVIGLRRARSLAEPGGDQRAEPLPIGLPVARRPRAYVALAVPVVLAAGIVVLVNVLRPVDPTEALTAGQCVNIVGKGTLEVPEPVGCSQRHSAEVTAVRNGATADSPVCTEETADYLGGPNGAEKVRTAAFQIVRKGEPAGVVCLVVAADGSDLQGSQRNTGR
jgi:hypothetical protein